MSADQSMHDRKGLDADRHDPLTIRIKDACRITGIGRSKLFELIKVGEIQTIKVGAITLVPMDSLAGFVDRRRGAVSTDPSA